MVDIDYLIDRAREDRDAEAAEAAEAARGAQHAHDFTFRPIDHTDAWVCDCGVWEADIA